MAAKAMKDPGCISRVNGPNEVDFQLGGENWIKMAGFHLVELAFLRFRCHQSVGPKTTGFFESFYIFALYLGLFVYKGHPST